MMAVTNTTLPHLSNIRLIVVNDGRELGIAGANEVESTLCAEVSPVFGVATGGTPLPLYEELARRKSVDPTALTLFGLDEYVGLSPDHPQTYQTFLRNHVAAPLGLDPHRVHLPDSNAHDHIEASARFEQLMLDMGGVSVQVLGIGSNGHIGFNEPGSSHTSRTRPVRLSDETRRDNARFFESKQQVPHFAITQGVGTILEARKLVLLARGAQKARALAAALAGTVSTDCPASALQLHPNVVVITDRKAAANLGCVAG